MSHGYRSSGENSTNLKSNLKLHYLVINTTANFSVSSNIDERGKGGFLFYRLESNTETKRAKLQGPRV